MRFMITGANGQLGSEWRAYLSDTGDTFEAYSSSELDITNKAKVEKKLIDFRPEVLINCAAYTKVDQAEGEPEKAFLVNAEAVEMLAGLCAFRNIKLLHYSTDYVFAGSEADFRELEDGYPENHQTKPVNMYGKSKLAGEKAIQNSGCDYLLIRVSWLCGQYGKNFIKTMLKLAEEREELSVVNDQYGAPTFAGNIVENSFQLLKAEQSGVFHLSSIGKITWHDFAIEIFRQAKSDIKIQAVKSSEFPTKAKRPAFSLLSTKKIANIPGVSLIPWKKGLQELLNKLD